MPFNRTLTDMYDGVRFGRIALQYPQGKADQQQLHLGISARRLIQALLGCPVLSKWSTQRNKKKKKIKTQCKTEPRSSSWRDKTRMKPYTNYQFFSLSLFFFFFFNQQKQADRRKVGSKKTRRNRRGPEVRLKRQVARRERPVLPLSLSPLSLRSGV